jgi:L-ascorbate metabolism protein UlaG (beta-lactamase superfamily)
MDRLSYIGHGTTLLRLDGASILTDPLLRGWLGPLRRHGPPPSPDLPAIPNVVLISHLHRDHLDVRSLRRLPSSTPLVVPKGASRWAKRGGAEEIKEIGLGETISIGGAEITGVKAVHNGHRDREFGEPIEPLGYLIRGGGRTVYFAGDTDLFPEMSDFGAVDLALLPVWGWGTSVGEGHLNPRTAAHALRRIRPRLAVPIHWGTFFPFGLRRFRPIFLTEPGPAFVRWAARIAPDVEVRVLEPGEELTLPPAP